MHDSDVNFADIQDPGFHPLNREISSHVYFLTTVNSILSLGRLAVVRRAELVVVVREPEGSLSAGVHGVDPETDLHILEPGKKGHSVVEYNLKEVMRSLPENWNVT